MNDFRDGEAWRSLPLEVNVTHVKPINAEIKEDKHTPGPRGHHRSNCIVQILLLHEFIIQVVGERATDERSGAQQQNHYGSQCPICFKMAAAVPTTSFSTHIHYYTHEAPLKLEYSNIPDVRRILFIKCPCKEHEEHHQPCRSILHCVNIALLLRSYYWKAPIVYQILFTLMPTRYRAQMFTRVALKYAATPLCGPRQR